MNNKYTFSSLCDAYDKIEVPIIQRDYAQGRTTLEVNNLRDKFINNFLIASIIKDNPVELDFVYGSILIENKDEIKQKTFIPLDGQQRLTTLFLLYYFIAVKENRLNEVKERLLKFTYETRPSAHDFCKKLLDQNQIDNIKNIKDIIEDSVWFNNDWKNDPTVSGMLNMLNTFSKNTDLINPENKLLDKILNNEKQLISFYFTDLEEFGLTENLYIRMNARGKMLTDFENFKSEFSKIIRYNQDLLEDVKNKIEYLWVENLWDYKENKSFIVDTPFMNYLSFITEMLYYKDSEFRSDKPYESNFLDLNVLTSIYSKVENLKFLIFSFDFIKEIKSYNEPVLWNGESIHIILKNILTNKKDSITQMFVLFEAINYCFHRKPNENIFDFIRVIRNLISNTNDNSRREWSRLISSINNLIKEENVYQVLSKMTDQDQLIGFSVEQRKEEIFKAKLILNLPEYKENVFEMEDHKNFTGNITNLLIAPFVNNEYEFENVDLDKLVYSNEKMNELLLICNCYSKIAHDDFKHVWGNFLITGLYQQTYDSRLIFSKNFKKHPSIISFAKNFSIADSGIKLEDYITKIQKKFIANMITTYDDFEEIRNVKEQLYLYYITEERIYNRKYYQFFKNNNFNFGWLRKENGFKSIFTNGIDGCKYFPETNPIFQVYNQIFRYNLGLNVNNTLDIEIIGGNKKRDPFLLLKEWALK